MESARVGVRVKIFLLTGHQYNGVILEEDEKIILIKDKFGCRVELNKDSIQVLQEVTNNA